MRTLIAVALLLAGTLTGASQAQTLKVGYSPDWAPYSVAREQTTIGILPALLEAIITDKMGVAIEHVALPWKRVQSMVKAGSLDALITFPSEDRLAYADRSRNVVYNLEFKAFVRKGSKSSEALMANSGVGNLKHHTGCIILGNDWAENFYKTHAIPYQGAVDVKNCLRLLQRDRVDFMIQAAAVGLDNIRQLAMESNIVSLPEVYSQVPLALMISKKSTFHKSFLPEFDAVVDAMRADGSLTGLIEKLQNIPLS